ncbi:transposase [Chryseobacterium sp. T16E-39]|nr:transposase [Chryseobacterium sp. T16E-39]
MNKLKDIHIGKLIHDRANNLQIPIQRITKFLNCKENDVENMYEQKSMDTFLLLRWSKLLEYDFFRIYTGHLILYAPPSKPDKSPATKKDDDLLFRKNIYTDQLKTFILEKINTKVMTPQEVISTYKIPKTTLYKWLRK